VGYVVGLDNSWRAGRDADSDRDAHCCDDADTQADRDTHSGSHTDSHSDADSIAAQDWRVQDFAQRSHHGAV
jgi:hypothetical protein